jgi:hypothetical protein
VLRWLADENFNNDILRALFRSNPAIDIVRAQDVGLMRNAPMNVAFRSSSVICEAGLPSSF